MSFGYDPEAIYQDADIEQAELEQAGNEYARRVKRMKEARERGEYDVAASACPHGSGYPLDSLAATNSGDPNAGEPGYRCTECGSRLDVPAYYGGLVTVACELR